MHNLYRSRFVTTYLPTLCTRLVVSLSLSVSLAFSRPLSVREHTIPEQKRAATSARRSVRIVIDFLRIMAASPFSPVHFSFIRCPHRYDIDYIIKFKDLSPKSRHPRTPIIYNTYIYIPRDNAVRAIVLDATRIVYTSCLLFRLSLSLCSKHNLLSKTHYTDVRIRSDLLTANQRLR